MKIDWTKQPTPEHCWLEDITSRGTDFSGWYRMIGGRWVDGATSWCASGKGEHFTIHRKPEEYTPKVGEWCYLDTMELFYVGIGADSKHIMQLVNGQVALYDKLDGFKPLPPKTDRELLIDIILGVGNMSEGVLADAILEAGFSK